MTPILLCYLPELTNHPLVLSGRVDACHYIHCDPHHAQQPDLDNYKLWCDANPDREPIVSLGWLGVEGFDLNRLDDNGKLDGCTQAEFDRGMAGKGFKMTRDLAKCQSAFQFFRDHDVMPSKIHIDHEPSTTPDFRKPLIERARFDALRVAHFKKMLQQSQLYDSVDDIIVEFTQFSNNKRAMAFDYNGQRVPFNPVRDKFRSSTELYSRDVTTTIKLAAWLAAVDSPAMPVLSAVNPDMLRDQLDLCTQRKATPLIFIFNDPASYPSVDWQMARLAEVLQP